MAKQPTPKSVYKYLRSKDKNRAIASYGREIIGSFEGHKAAQDITASSTSDIIRDVSVREEFRRSDYTSFRPSEQIPQKFKDILMVCRAVYKRVGLVRQVIDLMTDFVCEDWSVVHPDERVQIMMNVFRKKAGLSAAADEFVRHFLVDGNVVVRRKTAKLNLPVERKLMENISAAPDIRLRTKDLPNEPNAREIPWRYTFLDPAGLEWIGGEAGEFSDERQLAVQLSRRLLTWHNKVKDSLETKVLKNLPAEVKNRLKKGETRVPLDMSKLYITHYRKDSWDDWAVPFLLSVLPDVYFKDKLRQAEISALDGVINVIRIWKLGDHTEEIFPGPAAMEKLANILQTNTGGGALDIVWDSLIAMEEYYPPIDDILGSEKYEQVNSDLLIGLGVPEVLIGGKGANFSNSAIQLKTMVERLETVRNALANWLEHELQLFAKAMGISPMPKIKFGHMNLQDENTTRQLILSLLDRQIISVETALEYFGEDAIIEHERRKQEKKDGIKIISPLEKDEQTPGGNGKDSTNKTNTGKTDKGKQAPSDKGGRPKNTKDDSRKPRTPKPRTTAQLIVYANNAVNKVSDAVTEWYLDNHGVKNARQLTSEQRDQVDALRVSVLSCIKPKDELSKESIQHKIEDLEIDEDIVRSVIRERKSWSQDEGREPNLSEKKYIEALAWAKYREDSCEV